MTCIVISVLREFHVAVGGACIFAGAMIRKMG
jgi:hypothetical protein